MTYKVMDLFTKKLLGEYKTAEQAAKAESHLDHQPGEIRYTIEAPIVKKPKTKKASVKKESE